MEGRTATAVGNLSYTDPGLTDLWDGEGPFCCGASGVAERFRTIIGVYNSALFRPEIATQYYNGTRNTIVPYPCWAA